MSECYSGLSLSRQAVRAPTHTLSHTPMPMMEVVLSVTQGGEKSFWFVEALRLHTHSQNKVGTHSA